MKDGLNEAAIERIGAALQAVDTGFSAVDFRRDALSGLDQLELKERVRHVINALAAYLPPHFPDAAKWLLQIKPHWNPGDPADNLRGFAAWPLLDYVGEYGLGYPEIALDVLQELTSLFSAEFAIRPFYLHSFEQTRRRALSWCSHPDEHVRRLASEGIRPRLPWGVQLKALVKDPSPLLPLLDKLIDDPSEYVRRSVANNLNDIAKDHPEVVIEACRRWQERRTSERDHIIRHATRTLVKAGHPAVFSLLGFADNPRVVVKELQVKTPKIQLGDSVTFQFILLSTGDAVQRLVLDYAVHFMKANGTLSAKVFKFTVVNLAPGEQQPFAKQHAIRKITTRTYYPGKHRIEILVNGVPAGSADFELVI